MPKEAKRALLSSVNLPSWHGKLAPELVRHMHRHLPEGFTTVCLLASAPGRLDGDRAWRAVSTSTSHPRLATCWWTAGLVRPETNGSPWQINRGRTEILQGGVDPLTGGTDKQRPKRRQDPSDECFPPHSTGGWSLNPRWFHACQKKFLGGRGRPWDHPRPELDMHGFLSLWSNEITVSEHQQRSLSPNKNSPRGLKLWGFCC